MACLTFYKSQSWDLDPSLSVTKYCEHGHYAVLKYHGGKLLQSPVTGNYKIRDAKDAGWPGDSCKPSEGF